MRRSKKGNLGKRVEINDVKSEEGSEAEPLKKKTMEHLKNWTLKKPDAGPLANVNY